VKAGLDTYKRSSAKVSALEAQTPSTGESSGSDTPADVASVGGATVEGFDSTLVNSKIAVAAAVGLNSILKKTSAGNEERRN